MSTAEEQISARQRLTYAVRIKPVLDRATACVLLTATAPLHALLAGWVALDDGFPIYFRQERIGRNGVAFQILKFRTMKNGTHEASCGYPTPDRLTRSGRWLRRTSLDEIPQLWNVAKGEMSFVGPRPTLRDQVDRYTEEQRLRLRGTPGMTGLAQVRHRNNAPWSVRISTDLEYLQQLGPVTDLRILFDTCRVALTGAGQETGQTAEMVDDL